MAVEIVDACPDTENDVQDPRDPNELLGESSCGGEVGPRDDKCDDKDENKEDDGVGVEGEGVWSVIDASTIEAFVGSVALE